MAERYDPRSRVWHSQRMASDRYQRDHIRQYNLRLNERTDPDLIRFLETIPNRQGLIKSLLRTELEQRRNSKWRGRGL